MHYISKKIYFAIVLQANFLVKKFLIGNCR